MYLWRKGKPLSLLIRSFFLVYGKQEVDYKCDFAQALLSVRLCALMLKSPRLPLTPFTSFYLISTLIPKLHSFLLSFCIKLPKTLSYHSIQICSPAYLNTQTHLISHYCIALYNFFSYKLHYFSTSLKFPIANYQ